MENSGHDQVIGIPVSSVTYAAEGVAANPTSSIDEGFGSSHQPSSSHDSSYSKQKKKESIIGLMSKIGDIRDHVALGSNMAETVKGKLTLGARIVQAGGVEKVFRQSFSVGEGERLLKAFQCYLSTTAGPIPGMLFVSTEKVAFRSDRSLKLRSPKGDFARVPYKVLIPIKRVKNITPSKNMSKPNQKYIQIVTKDDFEFWFMGFVSSARSFSYLQQAISETTQ